MKSGDLVIVTDLFNSSRPKTMGIVLQSLEGHEVLVKTQRRILLSNAEIAWRNIWELETVE